MNPNLNKDTLKLENTDSDLLLLWKGWSALADPVILSQCRLHKIYLVKKQHGTEPRTFRNLQDLKPFANSTVNLVSFHCLFYSRSCGDTESVPPA